MQDKQTTTRLDQLERDIARLQEQYVIIKEQNKIILFNQQQPKKETISISQLLEANNLDHTHHDIIRLKGIIETHNITSDELKGLIKKIGIIHTKTPIRNLAGYFNVALKTEYPNREKGKAV